jgi:hypothetical protein
VRRGSAHQEQELEVAVHVFAVFKDDYLRAALEVAALAVVQQLMPIVGDMLA